MAVLARLGLSEAELTAARTELAAILSHFEALQKVDTRGVVPLVHALDTPGAPADDTVSDFPDPRGALLSLTKNAREGFFVVPRVLNSDGDNSPAER